MPHDKHEIYGQGEITRIHHVTGKILMTKNDMIYWKSASTLLNSTPKESIHMTFNVFFT